MIHSATYSYPTSQPYHTSPAMETSNCHPIQTPLPAYSPGQPYPQSPIRPRSSSSALPSTNFSPSPNRKRPLCDFFGSYTGPGPMFSKYGIIQPSENGPEELCLVCGDKASGYHYNALTCEGCKGFFRRSITKKSRYLCKYGNNCDIDMYMRRKCQFCRLRKCFAIGMRQELVIPEEQCKLKRDAKDKLKRDEKKKLEETDRVPPESPQQVTSTNSLSPPTAGSIAALSSDQNELINRLLLYQANTDTIKINSDLNQTQCKVNLADLIVSSIQLEMDFARLTPGFVKINSSDQSTLLKSGSFEALILRFCRRYDSKTDTIAFGKGDQVRSFSRDLFTDVGIPRSSADQIFDFARSVSKMKIDDTEFALLYAITVFSARCHSSDWNVIAHNLSTNRLGLSDPKTVEAIQEVYTGALQAYIDDHRPKNKTLLARLLMKLTDLRSLSSDHGQAIYSLQTSAQYNPSVYTTFTPGNVSEAKNPCDSTTDISQVYKSKPVVPQTVSLPRFSPNTQPGLESNLHTLNYRSQADTPVLNTGPPSLAIPLQQSSEKNGVVAAQSAQNGYPALPPLQYHSPTANSLSQPITPHHLGYNRIPSMDPSYVGSTVPGFTTMPMVSDIKPNTSLLQNPDLSNSAPSPYSTSTYGQHGVNAWCYNTISENQTFPASYQPSYSNKNPATHSLTYHSSPYSPNTTFPTKIYPSAVQWRGCHGMVPPGTHVATGSFSSPQFVPHNSPTDLSHSMGNPQTNSGNSMPLDGHSPMTGNVTHLGLVNGIVPNAVILEDLNNPGTLWQHGSQSSSFSSSTSSPNNYTGSIGYHSDSHNANEEVAPSDTAIFTDLTDQSSSATYLDETSYTKLAMLTSADYARFLNNTEFEGDHDAFSTFGINV